MKKKIKAKITILLCSVVSVASSNERIPDAVDWRDRGAIGTVKDQMQCKSSWALSTIDAVESFLYLTEGKKLSLSAQQLIDCSAIFGSNGCSDGSPKHGFHYIIKNRGISLESEYPYQGVEGVCPTNLGKQATINSYRYIEGVSEKDLMAILQRTPVVSFIDTEQNSNYTGGIYESTDCTKKHENAVLVVGYGTEQESGKPYWIVKNSLGESWGEKGYIRILRGNNQCGIADRIYFLE